MKKFIILMVILVSGLITKSQIIPPLGVVSNYTLTPGQSTSFYDPSGPGGLPCTTGLVSAGSYSNCACFTTITINAAVGEFLVVSFNEFSMWNTTSGWDWMSIHDGNSIAAPVLYDNSSTGPDNPFGDCGLGATVLDFCSVGRSLTFRFWATSVVNRAGWDATVSSVLSACGPLPVELNYFTAETVQGTALLSWSTFTEVNNDYFTVEKSKDAKNWEIINTTLGAGNSNIELEYSYIDYEVNEGVIYYRLSQTDFDDTTEYFRIVSLVNKSSTQEIPTAYDTLGRVIINPKNYIGVIIYKYKNGFWYKVSRLR